MDRDTRLDGTTPLERLPGLEPASRSLPLHLGQQAGVREAAPAPLLTIAEVARHYRISERRVRRRVKDGTRDVDAHRSGDDHA